MRDCCSHVDGPRGSCNTRLDFAGPLTKGIEDLIGLSDTRLEVGYRDTFVTGAPPAQPNGLTDGYVAVIDAARANLDVEQLHVDEGHLCVAGSDGKSEPFEEHDFMLLRFERLAQIDDWERFPTLAETAEAAVKAAIDGDTAATDRAKKAYARRSTRAPTSPRATRCVS